MNQLITRAKSAVSAKVASVKKRVAEDMIRRGKNVTPELAEEVAYQNARHLKLLDIGKAFRRGAFAKGEIATDDLWGVGKGRAIEGLKRGLKDRGKDIKAHLQGKAEATKAATGFHPAHIAAIGAVPAYAVGRNAATPRKKSSTQLRLEHQRNLRQQGKIRTLRYPVSKKNGKFVVGKPRELTGRDLSARLATTELGAKMDLVKGVGNTYKGIGKMYWGEVKRGGEVAKIWYGKDGRALRRRVRAQKKDGTITEGDKNILRDTRRMVHGRMARSAAVAALPAVMVAQPFALKKIRDRRKRKIAEGGKMGKYLNNFSARLATTNLSSISDTKKLLRFLRSQGTTVTKGVHRDAIGVTGYFPKKMVQSKEHLSQAASYKSATGKSLPTKRFINIQRGSLPTKTWKDSKGVERSVEMGPRQALWHEAGHSVRRSSQIDPNKKSKFPILNSGTKDPYIPAWNGGKPVYPDRWKTVHQVAAERGANRSAMKLADRLGVSKESRKSIRSGLRKSYQTYKKGLHDEKLYSSKYLALNKRTAKKIYKQRGFDALMDKARAHQGDALKSLTVRKKMLTREMPSLRNHGFSSKASLTELCVYNARGRALAAKTQLTELNIPFGVTKRALRQMRKEGSVGKIGRDLPDSQFVTSTPNRLYQKIFDEAGIQYPKQVGVQVGKGAFADGTLKKSIPNLSEKSTMPREVSRRSALLHEAGHAKGKEEAVKALKQSKRAAALYQSKKANRIILNEERRANRNAHGYLRGAGASEKTVRRYRQESRLGFRTYRRGAAQIELGKARLKAGIKRIRAERRRPTSSDVKGEWERPASIKEIRAILRDRKNGIAGREFNRRHGRVNKMVNRQGQTEFFIGPVMTAAQHFGGNLFVKRALKPGTASNKVAASLFRKGVRDRAAGKRVRGEVAGAADVIAGPEATKLYEAGWKSSRSARYATSRIKTGSGIEKGIQQVVTTPGSRRVGKLADRLPTTQTSKRGGVSFDKKSKYQHEKTTGQLGGGLATAATDPLTGWMPTGMNYAKTKLAESSIGKDVGGFIFARGATRGGAPKTVGREIADYAVSPTVSTIKDLGAISAKRFDPMKTKVMKAISGEGGSTLKAGDFKALVKGAVTKKDKKEFGRAWLNSGKYVPRGKRIETGVRTADKTAGSLRDRLEARKWAKTKAERKANASSRRAARRAARQTA